MMTHGRVILVTSALLAMTLQPVSGHGRMIEPPARSTMWRYGFGTPKNYNDNALNCGGLNVQWYVNQGKCGVCGDPWSQPPPRDNEAGGRYGKGIITRTYTPGQDIEVRIEITANHRGYFEFRLCPHNDPSTPVTQQCFDQNLLPMADGSGTQYTLDAMTSLAAIKLKLPASVTCSQCVLQWKWHAGNNYGNTQEEFYGCSDIAIGSATARPPVFTTPGARPTAPPTARPTAPPTARPTAPPTFRPITARPTASVTSATPAGSLACRGINSWQGDPKLDQTCTELCLGGHCPPLFCSCSGSAPTNQPATVAPPTAPPSTARPTASVSSPVPSGSGACRGINSWQGVPQLDRYCNEQCPLGNCPPLFCACSGAGPVTGQPATTAPPRLTTAPPRLTTAPPRITTTAPPVVTAEGALACRGINSWLGDPQKDLTCNELCRLGNCPPLFCACSGSATTAPPRRTTAPPRRTTAPPQRTTAPPSRTTASSQAGRLSCHGINVWQGVAELDQYCNEQCAIGNCPANFCSCTGGGATPNAPTTVTPHLQSTVTPLPQTVPPSTTRASASGCVAIGSWQGNPAQDAWCNQWCPTGLCPSKNCQCGVLPTAAAAVTTTTPPQQQQQCRAIGTWAGHPDLDLWCTQTCSKFACDPQYCSCGPTSAASSAPSITTTTTAATTTTIAPSTSPARVSAGNASCHAINTWAGNVKLSEYCNQQCHSPGGYCPPQYCACGGPTAAPPQTVAPAAGGGAQQSQCRAINTWQGVAELDKWCTDQCAKGNCPAAYCSCQP